MKTLVCTTPGQLDYRTDVMPAPQPGHALVRIRRIGICGTDLHAFDGSQPYFSYPRVLGHELAGELISVDGDTDCRVGETVTIMPYFHCGYCVACRAGKTNCCERLQVAGVHIDGGMTEYLTVPTYALLPGNGLSLDQLALVEPLAIGAHGIRRADIQPGEHVLVMGAGPIGLGVMTFAKLAGATVTALDLADNRLAFCRDRLGIPHTVNARADDTMEQIRAITGGDMPTVVIDATGSLRAIEQGFSYLAHGGRYVLVGLQKGTISISHPEFHKREATLMSSRNATRADFEQVMNALKTGAVDADAFITHRVDFDEVAATFTGWLDPSAGVIKAMVSLS
ncbi:zinc-binding alcohol dehydrogenase family protein [Spirosoma rhododendri]|uniref:Zinc-binding alcohol dehydrogenase family protein n=1 Tax=Spirosoma rhododendri TaxID=2728024 RepID=A0A7L5DQM4_9BACT|nr:zinc-binding alcohol dehydrogenase family protein [Spirosoma rhododendri]QJD80729.1 zinc-binding alcohol dehydrogenase family protein [Spirosoma rhododendri]